MPFKIQYNVSQLSVPIKLVNFSIARFPKISRVSRVNVQTNILTNILFVRYFNFTFLFLIDEDLENTWELVVQINLTSFDLLGFDLILICGSLLKILGTEILKHV